MSDSIDKKRKAATGFDVVKHPMLNKGSSFTRDEASSLGVRGLIPGGASISLELKVENAITELRKKTSPLEKYIYLHTIQDNDETLYHACVMKHLIEVMPFVYTPTVGQACQQWSHIYRESVRGVYITLEDAGSIKSILANYPNKDIEVIVVTDGEAILGLGDLGANGMGISIGKLALYTACAGVHPMKCLPVHIDVGTNNEGNLADPMYLGLRQQRVRGEAFSSLMAEFMSACKEMYGEHVLIQFEDFGNATAFSLLDAHRESSCCFNDDIQGTASVILAGLVASLRLVGKRQLSEHRVLFYGAGAAGVGIADLIAIAVARECEDISVEQARKQIWLVDSKGLVVDGRGDTLAAHKVNYAHAVDDAVKSKVTSKSGLSGSDLLLNCIEAIRPSALLGVSAQGGSFTEAICKAMAAINERPVIFALSNPTTLAECTPTQAYTWTNGKAVYSSGSPFDRVTLPSGQQFKPGQGNNAFIFPGVGLAAVTAGATSITDADFYVAAYALAGQVSDDSLALGCVYPPLEDIRDVSAHIAAAVVEQMFATGRATKPRPSGCLVEHCRKEMYVPSY
mmetsp:Transcript_235/g.418  ORF Transcript_235/g.418 Transcript_235/m.418 type:complete len:569 (+) Transcript_235:71-1777(+)|eukprot:CAMPEP_0185021540 /NCGR_PEP_ID=MMETSP1103-20130426/4223_1 /TAXON_ID=36769 /ORGANISM="Paraphysomonas bandaiensis, Strain Caron Lab Isolate" /LENGTH=568 /DNA_ID=CAMNT_0027553121 /DNA_START=54 /DNA_END=1760 /DNA_ORIENTATION=-